jgi:hypothetical protein
MLCCFLLSRSLGYKWYFYHSSGCFYTANFFFIVFVTFCMTAKQRIKDGERVRIRERKTKVTLHRKDRSKEVQKSADQCGENVKSFRGMQGRGEKGWAGEGGYRDGQDQRRCTSLYCQPLSPLSPPEPGSVKV